MRHYLHSSMLSTSKPVNITLIGAGATGSQVLSGLARIDFSLKALGHAGLIVTVFDGDTVAQSNIGRQLYSPSDIGRNKAEVMVTRVNMFFGLQWRAMPWMFNLTTPFEHVPDMVYGSNLVITAVDTVAARLFASRKTRFYRYSCYYWMDLGNTKDTGQVILGTRYKVNQYRKKDTVAELPTVLNLYPNMKQEEKKEYQGPSCSVAAALEKQDLFVNQWVASTGLQLLWKGIRQGFLEEHGAFINLRNMSLRPLPVDPVIWVRMMGTKPTSLLSLAKAA